MYEFLMKPETLPIIFAFLMGLSMLIYAILDGYDLGVGILSFFANDEEKDQMIKSIAPFWDANETWLVLGVGILLVAFPKAHGIILTNLYLPVLVMLIGLIIRGVSFEFRIKVAGNEKQKWNKLFFLGSLLTAFAQGFMLGEYILGFETNLSSLMFSFLVGSCLVAGYSLIGACWLIMKTENILQKKAIQWAKYALYGGFVGIILVSLATPYFSKRIFEKWFTLPYFFYLSPIPVLTALCAYKLKTILDKLPQPKDKLCWAPFILTCFLYILSFGGLAYSFYPYIVPEKLEIIPAASAPESLFIIFIGAIIVLPILLAYTAFAYKIFYGKVNDIEY